MKEITARPTRDVLAPIRVCLLLVVLVAFLSCAEREGVDIDPMSSEIEVVQNGEAGSLIQIDDIEKQIDAFVSDQLLAGITLGKLYEVDKLKATFGKYQTLTQEPAQIDYEGMKGDHLNRYRYKDFDLVFYVVEPDREMDFPQNPRHL